ncbi:hypothetical protein TorRG33x02_066140 [Trema orientale]|uniref:Uncharacterized protein n=1 Tax=Trema orientale TaxID=63057 RepID=A0A2P5FIV0_TREOI|nr:hypothetical protein TorRG33x02_066140 [Trema orientale]
MQLRIRQASNEKIISASRASSTADHHQYERNPTNLENPSFGKPIQRANSTAIGDRTSSGNPRFLFEYLQRKFSNAKRFWFIRIEEDEILQRKLD